MVFHLVKLLAEVAIAATAAVAANQAVKAITGRSIIEHVASGWGDLRDVLSNWVAQHPDIKLVKIFAVAVKKIDQAGVTIAKMFNITGQDQTNKEYVMTTRKVDAQTLNEMGIPYQDRILLVSGS